MLNPHKEKTFLQTRIVNFKYDPVQLQFLKHLKKKYDQVVVMTVDGKKYPTIPVNNIDTKGYCLLR